MLVLRGLPFPFAFASLFVGTAARSLASRPVSERAVETVAVTAAVPSFATRCFLAGRISSGLEDEEDGEGGSESESDSEDDDVEDAEGLVVFDSCFSAGASLSLDSDSEDDDVEDAEGLAVFDSCFSAGASLSLDSESDDELELEELGLVWGAGFAF